MTVWVIEPRDPLIVRDGRPFGPVPGARARTLSFPYPSTTTGAVRTRAGLDAKGVFDTAKTNEVKTIEVAGPFLVELSENNELTWFAPAPADALLLRSEASDSVMRYALAPLALPTGLTMDLNGVQPVGMKDAHPEKPMDKPPRYWQWNHFEAWLRQSADGEVDPSSLGISGPLAESRIHAALAPDTGAAKEGALFQTSGLEFRNKAGRRLGLAVVTARRLPPGVSPMGGERRLVSWSKSDSTYPSMPNDILDDIVRTGACRIVLMTPAIFNDGYLPAWLQRQSEGVAPELVACAVGRYETISGWDLQTKSAKPTRRLAPAGSVYFLRLQGEEAAIRRWVDSFWFASVSDEANDRHDGFGIAVVGCWSGKLQEISLPSLEETL